MLQKLLQTLAWRVCNQRLRVTVFCDTAFIDEDKAGRHFLGEADFLRFAFAQLRRGAHDFSLSLSDSPNRRLEQAIRLGGTLVFHPNRTERQMHAVYAQMCSVAETRNPEALAAWLPDWGNESQLRNPVGRLLAAMAVPAFAKIPKEIWKSEDLRCELLAKAQPPSAPNADRP